MRRHRWALAALATVLLGFGLSESGRAFTYQGRLHDDGDPAQGRHEMVFRLYDAEEGGRAVGPELKRSSVELTNGYFTVELDFGTDPSIFNGQPRWLDASVKPTASMDAPVHLTPRHRVSPTPYTIRSVTAREIQPLSFATDHIVRLEIAGERHRYYHFFNTLSHEVEVVEYRDGNSGITRKLPGRVRVPNIELRRFAASDDGMRAWFQEVAGGAVRRETVQLTVLDRRGYPVERWRFVNAWPCKVEYNYDPLLGALVETTVLAAEEASRPTLEPTKTPDLWYPGPQPVVPGPFAVELGADRREFDSIAGIGGELEVIEFQDGDDLTIRKRPGRTRVLDPVFVRSARNDDVMMKEWFQGIGGGAVERRQITVLLETDKGTVIGKCALKAAWPYRIETGFDGVLQEVREKIFFAAEEITCE